MHGKDNVDYRLLERLLTKQRLNAPAEKQVGQTHAAAEARLPAIGLRD